MVLEGSSRKRLKLEDEKTRKEIEDFLVSHNNQNSESCPKIGPARGKWQNSWTSKLLAQHIFSGLNSPSCGDGKVFTPFP